MFCASEAASGLSKLQINTALVWVCVCDVICMVTYNELKFRSVFMIKVRCVFKGICVKYSEFCWHIPKFMTLFLR
jgi:hypothetical protein